MPPLGTHQEAQRFGHLMTYNTWEEMGGLVGLVWTVGVQGGHLLHAHTRTPVLRASAGLFFPCPSSFCLFFLGFIVHIVDAFSLSQTATSQLGAR